MFIEDDSVHCEYLVAGKLSSPSCQELGIPRDEKRSFNCYQIKNASVNIDSISYQCKSSSKVDPFSPYCMIPLPAPFGSGLFDPTCIRRRNERERERVRCVNEGYIRLKEHLPIENKDKRISKVETLRGAIKYIKHLQKLLGKDADYAKVQSSVKCDYSMGIVSHKNSSSHENHDSCPQGMVADTDSETDTSYLSSDSADAFSDCECK